MTVLETGYISLGAGFYLIFCGGFVISIQFCCKNRRRRLDQKPVKLKNLLRTDHMSTNFSQRMASVVDVDYVPEKDRDKLRALSKNSVAKLAKKHVSNLDSQK